MSTAAERTKAKAERLAASRRSHQAEAEDVAAVPELPRSGRVKPLRMTLDLAPALHNEFEDWAIATSRQLGSVVNRTDVMRILVRRLLSDEDLQREVIETLRFEARR